MKGITVAFSRAAPKIYGACGRLIVVEHGGKLLENFIDHPWTIRCEIAMQLLSLVNLFWVSCAKCFMNSTIRFLFLLVCIIFIFSLSLVHLFSFIALVLKNLPIVYVWCIYIYIYEQCFFVAK